MRRILGEHGGFRNEAGGGALTCQHRCLSSEVSAEAALASGYHHPEAASIERSRVNDGLLFGAVLDRQREVVVLGTRVVGHRKGVAPGDETAADDREQARAAEGGSSGEAPTLSGSEHA